MGNEVHNKIHRYMHFENALSELISGNEEPSREELALLDGKISHAFDDILNSKPPFQSEKLDRIRFLSAKAKSLMEPDGLLADIFDTMLADIDDVANTSAENCLLPSQIAATAADFDTIELCYCSKATQPLSQRELKTLFASANKKNRRNGLSGVLLYNSQTDDFFQTLEGPRSTVERLMDDIVKDPRHRDMIIDHLGDIKERSFEHLSMALITSEEMRTDGIDNIDIVPWLEERLAMVINGCDGKAPSLVAERIRSMNDS